MSWNGKQFGRPLVMLQRDSMEALCTQRGYKPPESIEGLLPQGRSLSPELALAILLHNGQVEEAVNLLSYAIVPRVGVWWAFLCYKAVMEDIERDRAKDGLTPQERRAKEKKELVDKLTDISDINAMVEERKKQIDEQMKQLEERARSQNYLNPAERIKLKLAWIQRAFASFEQSLPPGSLGKPDDPPAMQAAIDSITQTAKSNLENYVQQLVHTQKIQENISRKPDPIYEALRQKTAAVKPEVDKIMAKYFPLKLKGLPPRPTAATKSKAIDAALRWLLVPSDDNGKLACEAAIAAQDGPEAMLAYAAFWSSTNLKTDTGIAPTNMALPPLGINKTLLQLALAEGGETDYDQRYEDFLRIGIECADGTCTWDEYGHPVRANEEKKTVSDDRVFRTRYGFARKDTNTPR